MEKVTGVGGIFFKSKDPEKLSAWYRANLGIEPKESGVVVFEGGGPTVWSPFQSSTTYFAPSTAPFMINYRVRDLDAMLKQLRANGCQVDDKTDDSEFGKFGWVMDPEGNRIELWQPPAE
jgi:predicted enzyme related to lactoylglutathione lyase